MTGTRPAAILTILAAAFGLGPGMRETSAVEKTETVVQNGVDDYAGCTVTPDDDLLKLHAEEAPKELRVRFDDLHKQLRADKPRVLSARLELTFAYEWWTAYKHELRCVDASPGGKLDANLTIFGARLGRDRATKEKSWVGWDLPPTLVQRWIDNPATNKGLRIRFASSELLDAAKGGGKEVGFMGPGRKNGLVRYSPRLVIEYEGDLETIRPRWVTDFADERKLADKTILRWTVTGIAGTRIDIELHDGKGWVAVARDLSEKTGQYEWDTGPFVPLDKARLRIRAQKGRRKSAWTESREFRIVTDGEPFSLGALPTILKVRRDAPLEHTLKPAAAIELARGEEEGVQLIIRHADRKLTDVAVGVLDDLVSAKGDRIAARDVRVRPVGYVFATNHGSYYTERDGWFADVLLEKTTFDVEAETVQPVWISYRARPGTPAGTYRGKLFVSTFGQASRLVPFEITVWDFDIPVNGKLPVMIAGRLPVKALGLDSDSAAARKLRRRHEEVLLDHRMTPIWVLNKFSWTHATLPRKADGSFDFTGFDADVERLLARGMSRFIIAMARRPGKFGFPTEFSPQWKKEMRAYLKAMCAHLDEKGWLDRALFYSIDEAPRRYWNEVKMLYRLVKEVEPRLKVQLTLNEPAGPRALVDFADLFNVNLRQYHKSRIAEVRKKGKSTIWYVCCWPNENPNLFTEYPGVDPRVIGWMTWKFNMSGFMYWSSTAWKNAFADMGDRRVVDEIVCKWRTRSFGTYNGDGCLVYPGPGGTILSSVRLENLRDGFEDYEYLALLRHAVDSGTLKGEARARALKLLSVDDRICDMNFAYERTGAAMLRARREIARLLAGKTN